MSIVCRNLKGLTLVVLFLCGQTTASEQETTVAPRQQPRVPKTPRTTTTTTSTTKAPTRRLATHPPWPNDPTHKPGIKIATHAPWPGDPGYNRATHSPYPFHRDQYGMMAESEHLFPSRSTYAPYVYGSSSGSHDAKKKNILDKKGGSSWAKDIVAYLAAPFMMPSAITNAIGNIPNGLEVETLWGRIAKSVRSALNRRSEERNAAESTSDNPNVIMRMKKKLTTTGVQSIASLISKPFRMNDSTSKGSASSSSSSSDSKRKSVDKKFRDLVISKIVDFLRIGSKNQRNHITHSSKSPKASFSSASSSSSSSTGSKS